MRLSAYVLWAPPPDPLDPDPWTEPLARVRISGHQYVTSGLHAGTMVRLDALDLDGPDGWYEWAGEPRDVHPAWRGLKPVLEPARGLFPKVLVDHFTDTGCLILPLGGHDVVHAIVHGEDHLGWLMPHDPRRVPNPDPEVWVPAPGLADLTRRTT